MTRLRDVAGAGCASCDPIVRIVTYGRRGIDPYHRTVERRELVDGELRVELLVWPWGYVDELEVEVSIGTG